MKPISRKEWVWIILALCLMYTGMFASVFKDEAAQSALTGWLAGTWGAISLIIFCEERRK